MLGGGGGGGASTAMLGSPGGGAPVEGGGDNLASQDTSNSSLPGVFGEEEINNGRNNNSNNLDESDRNSAGNRWPREETLALLKIRFDMDVAFRDSNLKGPLWDDVSRKMAELGYHRNAKKCKEKFENVYKYHKRTKDGRSAKSEGKTYRFFEQLEALDQLQPSFTHHPLPPTPSQPLQSQPQVLSHNKPPPFQIPRPPLVLQNPTTTSSFSHQPISSNIIKNSPIITTPPIPTNPIISPNFQSGTTNFMVSTSSSTSSDDFQQRMSGKKRKWKDFFEKLMRDVVVKQEELQNKFLRTIEMRERERSMREEAWRMQEMARLNREHEILAQERSATAAKDAAVIAFLQKISGQPQPQAVQTTPPPPPKNQPPIYSTVQNPTATAVQQPQAKPIDFTKPDNECDQSRLVVLSGSTTPPSSSRWPKAEVEALIKLRTSLELKYQENGPKGPFWEEISATMRNLGYIRNAKRCKEKWENINKYFKKVKESNKQRPEDSKTCPYYHLLDALYKDKKGSGDINSMLPSSNINPLLAPIMAQPEQQWPRALQAHAHNNETQNNISNDDEEQDDMLDEDELDQDMEDEEEEEDNNGSYEVVANKRPHGASAATGSIGTVV